jgi:hypothetical protein
MLATVTRLVPLGLSITVASTIEFVSMDARPGTRTADLTGEVLRTTPP